MTVYISIAAYFYRFDYEDMYSTPMGYSYKREQGLLSHAFDAAAGASSVPVEGLGKDGAANVSRGECSPNLATTSTGRA